MIKNVFSFVHCAIVFIYLLYSSVGNQQTYESYIKLSDRGITFISSDPLELPLNNIYVTSLFTCGMQCNRNILCRTFIYDEITFYCQLYQSDVTTGSMTISASPSSRIGFIKAKQKFYVDYNKTCNYCEYDRYLICQNTTCRCPSSKMYWDGRMCQNKLLNGNACNSSLQCRQDLNLTCTFGWCQSTPSLCKQGATAIIFDDIPSKSSIEGNISSVYNGLRWTSGHYLNVSNGYTSTGYPFALMSGEYVGFFGPNMVIQTLILNNTITLNSCIMASGWSSSLNLTIIGYYFSTQLNTYSVLVNTYTRTIIELNWSGLNKIVFTSSGSGSLDVGFDNLCITF